MHRDGWDRARVLSLPYEENGYWWTQRRAMKRLLETVPFAPGQSTLDIGANTCWATATFAGSTLRPPTLNRQNRKPQSYFWGDPVASPFVEPCRRRSQHEASPAQVLRIVPKRSSNASRSSMATAWAKRLAVTVN
jgi:hypothetical protein